MFPLGVVPLFRFDEGMPGTDLTASTGDLDSHGHTETGRVGLEFRLPGGIESQKRLEGKPVLGEEFPRVRFVSRIF